MIAFGPAPHKHGWVVTKRCGGSRVPRRRGATPMFERFATTLTKTPFTLAVCALASAWGGCATPSDDSSADTQSALTAGANATSSDSAARSEKATACLTTYVECLRSGSDAATCKEALHECMRPPPPPDGGAPCDQGEGPSRGHGDGPPPPPPGDPSADGSAPPPPPFGPAPHDGADGGPEGGPRACIDALDQCASGSDAVDVCVSAAVSCFEALPKPPR